MVAAPGAAELARRREARPLRHALDVELCLPGQSLADYTNRVRIASLSPARRDGRLNRAKNPPAAVRYRRIQVSSGSSGAEIRQPLNQAALAFAMWAAIASINGGFRQS
jgi:hypothetical protein